MNQFQAMKDRAIKRAMREGAAYYIDRLIENVQREIPADRLFTRDDVVELLRGTSEGLREVTTT